MKYIKAIAALVGGLTPAAVVGVLALFGVHLDASVVGGVLAAASPLLALLATWSAPANVVPAPAEPAPPVS